jgi:hypothetical protein
MRVIRPVGILRHRAPFVRGLMGGRQGLRVTFQSPNRFYDRAWHAADLQGSPKPVSVKNGC